MRRCCSVASTPLHLVKEITLQCWLFYLDPIIIFLSDKSRPNRVRAEGSGANWGMRCGDRALHLGLRPAPAARPLPTRRLQMRRVHIPTAKEVPRRAWVMRVGSQVKDLCDGGRGRSRGNAVITAKTSVTCSLYRNYKDVCRHVLGSSSMVA